MKMSTPRHIYAKTSSDKNDCWITGIAVSPQNQIFATDCNNYSLKMIDIINGDIKQLQLRSGPTGVTFVTSDVLAVTMAFSKTIQFISFSQDSFSLKNSLKADGECYGITHHQGKLAITFINPGKLQIMDLKGNVEITVDKDSNGDNVFNTPMFATTNSHSIYVSDPGNDVVLRFNWQGEMIGLVLITEPMGITLLYDGSVLVNDGHSHCIHKVGGDCKHSQTVLEDVYRPFSVCWFAETSTLCVSRFKQDSGGNYIRLYKMKF
ncbi:uncharacterized protein LOC132734274 [Ruditapes philippinarum]|uniref:uncharacterized protein LOC132734274 n=1 Tax=Ruditapes philippinarum TaxID=129788 RepID=UPI00295ABC1E|nr:uncharacterized protein LOC132734274 [Ruditapes philippinarum]